MEESTKRKRVKYVEQKQVCPEYFTPSKKMSVTIRYVMFVDDSFDMFEEMDRLNYRTRKFAEELGVEWYSEVGIGKNKEQAAIFLNHPDNSVLEKCSRKVVSFMKKYQNIQFVADKS